MAYKSRFLYIDDNGDYQEGIAGGLFITNVQPVVPSNVVTITWKPGLVSGTVVDSIDTNTEDVIVTVEWDGPGIDWNGTVRINGIDVTGVTEIGNTRRFTGSATIDINGGDNIFAIHSDGAAQRIGVTLQEAGPEITNISFVGNYPGVQTEVKNNDTFQVRITFNPAGSIPSHFELSDFGACKAGTYDLSTTELNWGTVHTATITATIDATSSVATPLQCRGRARNSFGTFGEYVTSTNTVICNDVVPTFVDGIITYPGGRLAFKDFEVGAKNTTVSNYSSVVYSSPTGEFTIANNTTYEQNKTITGTNSNTYNDSTNNYRIVANRSQNGTSATFNKVIEVADVAPVVVITQPAARLRSSPSGADYVITATTTQHLATSPTFNLNVPISGTWQGASWGGTTKVKTRTIRIADSGAKGTGVWAFSGGTPTNRAGIPATITGSEVVGGFTARDIEIPAFGTTASLGTAVIDTSKLSLVWSFKTPMLFQPIGTSPPVASGWTISAVGTNPTTIIILDSTAAAASSQDSTINIGEGDK